MDNIIKFLNFEDGDLEEVDQYVKDGRRYLTVQKKIVPHFCPVCSYRMHSKGITKRTVNHPVMQDGLQLILIVHQRRWQCTNTACRNIVTDEFSRLKEKYIRFNNEHSDNAKKARPALNKLIHEYRFSGYKLFRDIADTLDSNFVSIINSFIVMERHCSDGTHISRLSNGPMESLNRITKDMKRNGRGFRNFEHLRNRFLFAERKNAQMLSTPLSPDRYKVKTGITRGPYKKKSK